MSRCGFSEKRQKDEKSDSRTAQLFTDCTRKILYELFDDLVVECTLYSGDEESTTDGDEDCDKYETGVNLCVRDSDLESSASGETNQDLIADPFSSRSIGIHCVQKSSANGCQCTAKDPKQRVNGIISASILTPDPIGLAS
ncbi:hypothetical protein KCU98_g32, partial [Aureobasidium melanogenum]